MTSNYQKGFSNLVVLIFVVAVAGILTFVLVTDESNDDADSIPTIIKSGVRKVPPPEQEPAVQEFVPVTQEVVTISSEVPQEWSTFTSGDGLGNYLGFSIKHPSSVNTRSHFDVYSLNYLGEHQGNTMTHDDGFEMSISEKIRVEDRDVRTLKVGEYDGFIAGDFSNGETTSLYLKIDNDNYLEIDVLILDSNNVGYAEMVKQIISSLELIA